MLTRTLTALSIGFRNLLRPEGDIEFLGQCLQRLYGGQDPFVRSGGKPADDAVIYVAGNRSVTPIEPGPDGRAVVPLGPGDWDHMAPGTEHQPEMLPDGECWSLVRVGPGGLRYRGLSAWRRFVAAASAIRRLRT